MGRYPPGTHLTKLGIVLSRGEPGSWDAGMVESPAVWFDVLHQKYCMVYTGYGRLADAPDNDFGYDTVTWPQIGLATSSDLVHWERESASPIFGQSGTIGSTDSHGAAGPLVIPPSWSPDEHYYLFYFGTTDTGYEAGTKTLNLATSGDLKVWQRYEGNPVVAPEPNDPVAEWRNEAIWHPNIIRHDSKYYLFFNTSGVHRGRPEEYIGYATSTDLREWTVHDDDSPIVVGSGVAGRWDSSGRAGDPSVFRHGNEWFMAFYSWDRVRSQDGMMMTSEESFPTGWRAYEGNPILRYGDAGTFDAQHAGKPFVFRTNEDHFHFYTAVDEQGRREIALATGNYDWKSY